MARIEKAIPLGGASLNFEVVGGTTQPSNPKENTIWINTNTAITDWVFSADSPAAPIEGMAWIKIGSKSLTPISITTDKTIMVYPELIRQYVNGAWVNKNAQVYKNDAWVQPRLLYLRGSDTFTDITGGWSQVNTSSGAYQPGTISSQGITLPGQGYCCFHMGTVQPVDLTNINTLYFVVPSISAGTNTNGYSADRTLSLGAHTTRTVTYTDTSQQNWAAEYFLDTPAAATDQLFAVDVSNLQGDYYLLMQLTCGGYNTQTVVISEIYGV